MRYDVRFRQCIRFNRKLFCIVFGSLDRKNECDRFGDGSFPFYRASDVASNYQRFKKRIQFALYNMVGMLTMSAGILVSSLASYLEHMDWIKLNLLNFFLFFTAFLGIGVMLTYFMLTKEIEGKRNGLKPLKMSLSPKSRNIITKLSGLFAVDSFAGGFVLQSIVSLWFFTKFGAKSFSLSYVFSIGGVPTAFSCITAAKIADRIQSLILWYLLTYHLTCF